MQPTPGREHRERRRLHRMEEEGTHLRLGGEVEVGDAPWVEGEQQTVGHALEEGHRLAVVRNRSGAADDLEPREEETRRPKLWG